MSIKIAINGEGLNYEADTTIQKAARIIQYINDTNTPQAPLGFEEADPFVQKQKKATTPRQAIIDAGAKTNPEKIATFIRFFKDTEDREGLDSQELVRVFIKSGEPKPKNISRDLKKAADKGYVTESEKVKGLYCLTDKGSDILDSGFLNQDNG